MTSLWRPAGKRGGSASHLRDFTCQLERFAKKHAKRLVAEITTKDIDAWVFGLKNSPQSSRFGMGHLQQFLWLNGGFEPRRTIFLKELEFRQRKRGGSRAMTTPGMFEHFFL